MLPVLRATRTWPLLLRLAVMAAAVGTTYLLQLPLEADVPGDPFLLFLLVVLACTLAFGQSIGICAVLATSCLSTHFFEPGGTFQIQHAGDLVRVQLYALLASGCVVIAARSGRMFLAAYEAAERASNNSVLLRELSHRVANNFATVASLIRRQAAGVADPFAKSALDDAVGQVTVMARIHRRLLVGNDNTSVESRRFVVELCDDLRAAML